MKKRIALVTALIAVFGWLFVVGQPAYAVSTFNTKDSGDVVVDKDAVHNGSYYAGGQNIIINGTINGDLYCAGQTVKVNGTVNGDVICGAQKIIINGTVKQDVRSAGQLITIAGQVGGSVSAFGQDITVSKNATIGGDLNGAGQTFTIDGIVGRDVAVAGSELAIDGLVKGNVNGSFETVSLTSKPAIMGSLDYGGQTSQKLADGSVIGEVTFNQIDTSSYNSQDNKSAMLVFYGLLAMSIVVTATVLSLLMPRYYERSFAIARKKIGMVVLVGIAVNAALPIVAIALMFTGVGIPLGVILLVGLALVQLLSFSFAAYYLSRALFGQVIHNVVPLMVVGAAILAILLVIPFAGVVAYIAALVFGTGILVSTVTNGYQKPLYSTEEEVVAEKPAVVKLKK